MSALLTTSLLLIGVFGCPPCTRPSVEERIDALRSDIEQCDLAAVGAADDTLALAIEWIRMRDSVSGGRIDRNADFFLGFLAGRLRSTPPDWWSYAIRQGNAFRDGHVELNCEVVRTLWKMSKDGLIFYGIDDLEIAPDSLCLVQGSRRVIAQRTLFDNLKDAEKNNSPAGSSSIHSLNGFSATLKDGLCVVVPRCGMGGPHRPECIYCLDPSTGGLNWKQDSLRRLKPPTIHRYGGPAPGHLTQVSVNSSQIIVWILDQEGASVEVFNRTDGKRVASFASYLLDGLHLRPH